MKPANLKNHSSLLLLAVMAGLLSFNQSASAATDTWQGNASALFSGANWTGGNNPPVSGDALVFGLMGSAGASLTADQTAAISYAGITFNSGASAYTIGGANGITLTGNVANNGASLETLNFPIATTAARTFTTTTGGGDLTLGGNITGTGGGIVKAGVGTLSLSGTSSSISGNLNIQNGKVAITAGSLTLGSFSFVGNVASLSGVASVASSATLNFNNANGGGLGFASAASGAIYNSGTYSATQLYMSDTVNNGSYGYIQNAGTMTVNNSLNIARGNNANVLDVVAGGATAIGASGGLNLAMAANATAGLNITGGGTFTDNKNGDQAVINSGSGAYTSINVSGAGSKLVMTGGSGINLNNVNSASTSIFSLVSGGELDCAYTYNNQSVSFPAIFNFNNGTYKATAANGLFEGTAGATLIYIHSGGATINNNGFSSTINSGLLAPVADGTSTYGVTGITLGGTTTGYIGAPVVKITGGGGRGAAAIASFDPATGTITGITVTAPGSGYTSAPTVTLAGGNGGSTGSGAGTATATASIGAVSSGGVTFAGIGSGSTTLSGGASTYMGNTVISGGTLKIGAGASLASSNINVNAGANYDVSTAGGTLAANQNILGGGVVTGAVTTASASAIYGGTDGAAGTLSFSNSLTMTSGSTFNLDVSTAYNSGNDQVVVAGTLTLNSTVIKIKALSGLSALDQSADYVLVAAGGISGSVNTNITWVGTQPVNAGNYSVAVSGNTIVMHYASSVSTPPTIVSATANPTTLTHGQSTLITAAVTPGSYSIGSVIISGPAIVGSPVTLNSNGAGSYTNNAIISASASPGSQTLTVTATDTGSPTASSQSNIVMTVVAANDIWNGTGSDNKWSTGANWLSGIEPGVGDSAMLAGTTELTNNLDFSLSIAALTFSNTAGSFDITNNSSTLTLTSGVTNNSTSGQTIAVPVVLNGAQTISAASGNVTMSGAVSDTGSAGLTTAGSGTLTLSAVNTYSGATTIGTGALAITGAGQLGGGTYSALITNNGTLNFNSSAAQMLSGVISGTGSLTQSGSNMLKLFGANTYTGNTTLGGGTLVVGGAANTSLGIGGTVMLNGGTLTSDNDGGVNFDPRVSNNIMAGGGGILGGSGTAFHVAGNISGSAALGLSGIFNGSGLRLEGDNSGYNGTVTVTNDNTRLGSAAAGSAAAAWVVNGNLQTDVAGGATFNFGSLSGSGCVSGHANNGSTAVSILSIGALNTSTAFTGIIVNNALNDVITGNPDGTQKNVLALTKTGTGTLTLSGASTYTGNTTLGNGIVNLGGAQNGTASGPLGANGAITFAGGTLQYSSSNNYDYSARITNSTGPIAIDLNGTNVTFASGVSASNTNGLALTNSTGTGTLTLTAGNSYTGNTLINAGTLALSGSGSIPAGTISVGSAGKLDVSTISFTLGSSQTLSGSGVVTGAVTTAGLTSFIAPGGVGTVGTLTFNNNLILGGGAALEFDLSASHSSGNDQVVVAGNLTLGASDVVHVNALGGSANLDQSGDYVLFSVAGTLSLAGTPLLQFDNTPPANAAHYTVIASGNNVVLHYSLNAAPTVNLVTVTNTVNGQANAVRGQQVTVYAIVSPGSGSVTNVSANLSSIGGSASQTLTSLGGNNYSYTLTVAPNATLGADSINVTATDTTPLSGLGSATLTINTSAEVWSGSGANDNWSTGGNWVSTYPPGYVGDSLDFTGGTRPTPNMDNNYNVAGLTFDGSADSFTLGSAGGYTLTLGGGVTNSSFNPQVINVPIILNGTQSILDPNGVGNTLAGNISGAGGLTMDTAGFGILTLSGTNTYTGNTTIPSVFGTLNIGNSQAIPSGAGKGIVSATGTLNLNGYNAFINGLSGPGTVDNLGGSAVALSIGNGDTASSFGGIIQNSGGALTLVKVGTNVLTLSGTSTYSGGTTLSAGQIKLGASSTGSGNSVASGPLGVGTVTLNGGTLQLNAQTLGNNLSAATSTATIVDNSGNNGTLSGNVSGSGTISIQNSSGNALSDFLSGDWSGFTGTLNYTTGSHIINIFSSGSVFDLSQATLNVTNASLNGSSSFRPATSETLRLGALAGPSGYIDGGGSSVIEIGNLNTSTTFGGAIRAGTGVTKVGTGTLTLSGVNSYTGPTIASNGTLVVSTLSTGGGSYMVMDGATLGVSVVSGGSLSVSNFNLASSISCTNTFIGLSSMVNPAITNTGALTLAGTVTVNVSGYVVIGQYPLIASASIGGTGGFILGSLPGGATGNIATNGNTIILNVSTGSQPYQWTGLNNGNWDMTTTNNWANNGVSAVYGDGVGVQFDDTSARTNVSVVVSVAPTTVVVSNTDDSYTIGGAAIAGSTTLTKNGNNALTLTGTNTFTGSIIISNGVVAVGGAGQLGGGTYSATITDNGALAFNSSANQTLAGVISGSGTLAQSGGNTLKLFAANTYAGNTTLGGGTLVVGGTANTSLGIGGTVMLNGGTLTSDNDGNVNFDPRVSNNITAGGGSILGGSGTALHIVGNISGSATLGLSGIFGQSGLRLEGDNSGYTGTVTVTNDNTRLGSATAGSAAAAWVVNGDLQTDVAGGATFKLGSLSGSGSISGHANNGSTAVSILNIGALNTSTLFSGSIVDNTNDGAQNNMLALTKVGAGTLTLGGANTYTANTTVSNGTLLVNGSVVGAAAVNGGALGGIGTIGGTVTVNSGGTLAPGTNNVGGTLTISGNVTLNAGSTNTFEVNGSTAAHDAIVLGGSATYGGVLNIIATGTFTNGQMFALFSGAGATGASSYASIAGSPGAGQAFGFTNGVLSVVATVSPSSTNAYLTSLVLSPAGVLSPGFTTNGYLYNATNSYGQTPTVTVTNADLTATNTLIYNGTPIGLLASGTASSPLSLTLGATNVVQVRVVSQDLSVTNVYTVNVTEQPSQSVPKLTNSVSGNSLVLSWPADHLGYRLLVQTNNLNKGVSGNINDWGTMAGSTSITATNIAIIKAGVTNMYYRLVYP